VQFVKLKELCEFEKGSTGLAKAESGDYPLVTTAAERKSCNTYQFETKAVCIPLVSSTGHGHASLKNVHYQEGKFALGSILVALTSKDNNRLDIQFLHLYLSQLKDQVLVPLMSGAANVALSVKKIQDIEIPLLSIERQREIVERFKSIVAEEDELKSELSHQQTLLKKLRQQILQEAIEGKLTADWRAQNPEVEPASELLKRITAEKTQLIKDKKIKAQKSLLPVTDEEKPFELPQGWEWCRMIDISIINPRNAIDDELDVGFTPMPFVSSDLCNHPKYEVRKWRSVKTGFTHFADGDIVIAKITPCFENSKSGVVSRYPNAAGAGTTELHVIRRIGDDIPSLYLYFIVKTTKVIKEGKKVMKGAVGQKRVPKEYIEQLFVPVPPAAEQHAIVTKVEDLLALCSELEAQIAQNQTHAEQLMQAVLKEAFSHNSEDKSVSVTSQTSTHPPDAMVCGD